MYLTALLLPAPARLRWLRRAAGLALALACTGALAQADPPARVARFDVAEGGVSFQPAADGQARPADTRWPLAGGDQVWTDATGRAEVSAGAAALRLGNGTALAFTVLDDNSTQVRLTSGTLGVALRDLQPGERFEINTPNLALVLTQPGRWRLDVDPAQGLTRVAVDQGSGTLYGGNGESQAMNAPLRRDFTGQNLASPAPLAFHGRDAFDRWSDERERVAMSSASLRYVAADVPGASQLDGYGDWGNDAEYGAVWYPRAMAEDWAPYRDGHWEWIAPWGWTWIDDAPWGFAPFHYGRWAQVNNRWGWVPGPRQRAAYAPALVGFVGHGGGPLNLGNGRSGVGWFPLAPGEAWRPSYNASPAYLARLNRSARDPGNGYQFQGRASAVTVVGANDFGRRPVRDIRQFGVPQTVLSQGQLVPPPQGRGFGGQPPRFGGNPGAAPVFGGQAPVPTPGLPPNASFNERVQQDQWRRTQEAQQAQQRAEQDRLQQQRQQQDRFSPGFQQRQQQEVERQRMQQMQQVQQNQAMQQRQIQESQQRQAQDQQRQMQEQQRQAQDQQRRMQEQQQRQAQEAQQRQAQDQQRQMQEQQRQAIDQQRRMQEQQQRQAQDQQRSQQEQMQRQQMEQQRQAQRQQFEQQRAAQGGGQPPGRPGGEGRGDGRHGRPQQPQ